MCCIQRFARVLSELHAEGRLSKKPAYHVDGICYNGDIEEEA